MPIKPVWHMIVFGEANFMLPRVIFGFHSWDNVVFPDLLKRSCCATCLCVVQTLDPFPSHALRNRPSNALNPKISVSSLRRRQSNRSRVGSNALIQSGRGSASAVCVCLLFFFSISVGFLASWIVVLQTVNSEENVEVFQDEKCCFSWSCCYVS